MTDSSVEWERDFPSWNAQNLETDGVMMVRGSEYRYVIEAHPAIRLLEVNAELIGIDVRNHPRVHGHWIKITNTCFNALCSTLRTRVHRYRLEESSMPRDRQGSFFAPSGPIDLEEESDNNPSAAAPGPIDAR
jgi:hypothetical protein